MNYKSVGEAIKKKRLEMGMSLQDLARSILKEDGTPITRAYVNDIEKNNRMPSAEILQKFEDALNFEPNELLNLAKKLSPETEKYILEQPDVGALLRKAKNVGFKNWKKLQELIDKEGREKNSR